MTTIAITGTTAITMDAKRRVIEKATIVFTDDRITQVGAAGDVTIPESAEIIDGKGTLTLPGLIDSHAHAGHGLTRNLGARAGGDAWFQACEDLYTRGSTAGFWQAEARLSALERLRAGITTCTMLLGGGADHYRTDTREAGDLHCAATREAGLRTMVAAGVNRAPFPKTYRSLDQSREITLSFEDQLAVCAELAETHNDLLGTGTGVCLIMPVYQPNAVQADPQTIRRMCRDVMDLREKAGLLFTQDGHRDGSIALAETLEIIGPWSYLSHSVDLTEGDMAAAKRSGTSIVHNPSAIMSVYGRCPAPELRDMGVNVALGSDAAAPDRGYDMFRHMVVGSGQKGRHRDAGPRTGAFLSADHAADRRRAIRQCRRCGHGHRQRQDPDASPQDRSGRTRDPGSRIARADRCDRTLRAGASSGRIGANLPTRGARRRINHLLRRRCSAAPSSPFGKASGQSHQKT